MIRLKGFTFLEVVIALFLFAIIMVGFAERAQVALDANSRSREEIIAANLKRSLMAEIMVKNFAEPGTEGGESRFSTTNPFDDVNDYNGMSETPPRTIGNVLLDGTGGRPNYSGFRWSVSVAAGATTNGCNNFALDVPPDVPLADCKEVIVDVTTPRGRIFRETEWRIKTP